MELTRVEKIQLSLNELERQKKRIERLKSCTIHAEDPEAVKQAYAELLEIEAIEAAKIERYQYLKDIN
jgi:hypothetical protein